MKGEKDSLEDGGDDERREGGVRRLVGRRRLQRLGCGGEMIDGKGKSDETRCFFCLWTRGWSRSSFEIVPKYDVLGQDVDCGCLSGVKYELCLLKV